MISLNERRPFVARIYPAPAWPFAALQLVFFIMICIGVAWFIYLRLTSPPRLSGVEHDVLVPDLFPQATILTAPHAGAAG
jgi:hypothetical protein